jgi:hypothetical protein
MFRRLRFLRDSVVASFEEPDVARYITPVGAPEFTLPDDQTPSSDRHLFGINAPGLIPGSMAVLFFQATPSGENPRFTVRVNQTNLTDHTFSRSEAGARAWHEIIPAGQLKPEDNELTFAGYPGGYVTFSDVIILYRSNKLTVSRPLVVSPQA